jgi:hypothetical protein
LAAHEIPLSLLAADPGSTEGYSNSPPNPDQELDSDKLRPKFGIRIHGTTAGGTADRAAHLAQRISELKFATRVSRDTRPQKDCI